MIDQLKTIREALEQAKQNTTHGQIAWNCKEALTALTQLEAMAGSQEPVAWTLTETLSKRETTTNAYLWFSNPVNSSWTPLYTAAPVAQQPQAEAVQYTRADLDRAYSAGLVEGERLAIQQAVLSKHVPMTEAQAKDIADSETWGPEAIAMEAALIRVVRATERHHGIGGEKGGA